MRADYAIRFSRRRRRRSRADTGHAEDAPVALRAQAQRNSGVVHVAPCATVTSDGVTAQQRHPPFKDTPTFFHDARQRCEIAFPCSDRYLRPPPIKRCAMLLLLILFVYAATAAAS